MVIVYDSVDEISEKIIILEDGHGDQIKIPTILIPKSAGLELKKFIENNPDTPISTSISFDLFQ